MEVILILIIIPLQGFLAWQTYQKIKELESVFESTEDAEIITGDVPVSLVRSGEVDQVQKYILSEEKIYNDEKKIEIALLSASAYNEVEVDIITNINGYLLKNKGAVADYHLLKDIVDRNIDSLDEEINNSMPAPLYLGLAATMFGIIIGLYNMPDFSPTTFSPNDLMPLLDGVKVAMMASVFGLLLTTGLSILAYKPSKSQAEKNKNGFLSFLQINLLPELVRTETSGISALNDRLKRFGSLLSPTIKDLSKIVERSLQAVSIQESTISKVEGLNTTKLAKANATVFQELSQMMDSFKEFATYYQELNRSMVQTVELTNNLKELVGRTIEVETIAKGIDSTFTQNKELNQFLAQNFIDIKSRETALISVVGTSERTLIESLDGMKEAVKTKVKEVENVTIKMEPQLKHAFDSSIRAVEQMTKEQVLQIDQAFEKSRPKFEKLDKLDKIEEGIHVLAAQGIKGAEQQDLLLRAIQELTSVVKESKSQEAQDTGKEDLMMEAILRLAEVVKESDNHKIKGSGNTALLAELQNMNKLLTESLTKKEPKHLLMTGLKTLKSKPAVLLGAKITGAVGLAGAVTYLVLTLFKSGILLNTIFKLL